MKNVLLRYTKHLSVSAAVLMGLSAVSNQDSSFITRAHAVSTEDFQAMLLLRSHPAVQNAIEVQSRNSSSLMNMEGVIGSAISVGNDGQPEITVYTQETDVAEVPTELEGIAVNIQAVGQLVAFTNPKSRQERPVPIGVSTGHNDVTAGTIGARVVDPEGNIYALSNNHVFANSNKATIGDSVMQPGRLDGGNESIDIIGTLADFEPIDFSGGSNYMDAAIALSSTTDLGYSTPADDGYGAPNTVTTTAYVGQEVQKYGRTTGLTKGSVGAINATVRICYDTSCNYQATFRKQIIINTAGFSDGGDSGSLVVTNDAEKNPVALLFAGNSSISLASPIDPILERFNVTIDTTEAEPEVTDVMIAGISVSDESITQGDTTTFSVEVQNAGDTDAVGISVSLNNAEGTELTNNQIIDSLAAGETTTVTFDWETDTYTATGEHTITVNHDMSDDTESNNSDSVTVSVNEYVAEEVEEVAQEAVSLTASKVTFGSYKMAYLQWTGLNTDKVLVYRNGKAIARMANDDMYVDMLSRNGTYSYKICTNDGSSCTGQQSVSF